MQNHTIPFYIMPYHATPPIHQSSFIQFKRRLRCFSFCLLSDKLHPVAAILSSEHSHWNSGHCINGKSSDFCHTKNLPEEPEPFPWLAIDFGETVRVSVGRVIIRNRGDCCGERTRNVEIRISDKLPTSRGKMFKGGYLLSKYSGPGKNGEEISLGSGQGWKENYGRYLIIQMDNGKDVLNFAEVTAFGGVQGEQGEFSLSGFFRDHLVEPSLRTKKLWILTI